MKTLKFVLLFFILAMLQISLMDYLKIMQVKPDLLLCFVILSSLYFGSWIGLGVGFICGITADVLSIGVFGTNTALLSLLGYTIDHIDIGLYKENFVTQIIVGLLSAIFFFTVYRLIAVMNGISLVSFLESFQMISIASLYTVLILPFMSLIFKKICA